jgi:hypothetical protein
MHKRITLALTGAALALSISGGAHAQQAAGGTSPTTPPAAGMHVPTPDYSDAQLQRFVSASQKVALISQEYTPKLEITKDEATRIQHDPELARRIQGVAR